MGARILCHAAWWQECSSDGGVGLGPRRRLLRGAEFQPRPAVAPPSRAPRTGMASSPLVASVSAVCALLIVAFVRTRVSKWSPLEEASEASTTCARADSDAGECRFRREPSQDGCAEKMSAACEFVPHKHGAKKPRGKKLGAPMDDDAATPLSLAVWKRIPSCVSISDGLVA